VVFGRCCAWELSKKLMRGRAVAAADHCVLAV
jgi:hypothetical protein